MTDADRHVWQPWEGRTLDGTFVLTRCLGGTGRAGVYLTEYAQKAAAIKLVPCEPAAAGELLAQWETASKWSHPSLLKIFAGGQSRVDKVYVAYVVEELAEDDLAEVLLDRKLTEQEARDALPPTLAALGYLHEMGFAHGRVKASNVMAVGERVKLSSDRAFSARNSADRVTDVRALGALLNEVLPAPLPPPFAEIARRCLTPDPLERWTIPMIEAHLGGKFKWGARAAAAAARSPRQTLSTAPVSEIVAAPEAPASANAPASEVAWASAAVPTEEPSSAQEPLRTGRGRKMAMWVAAAVLVCGLVAALGMWLGKTGGDSGATISDPPRQPESQPAPAAKDAPDQPRETAPAPKRAATPKAESPSTSASTHPVSETPVPPKPEAKDRATAKIAKPAPESHGEQVAPSTPSSSKKSNGRTTGPSPDPKTAIVTQVMPEISKSARGTIHGRVRINVRAQVDADGNVASASLDSPNGSHYLSERALAASRRWKFGPEGSARAWVLRYEILRDDMRVTPVPAK